jgi:hypothetical protein
MYKPGQWISAEDLDQKKIPQGYVWLHGRITRVQKTLRPEGITPEVWSMFGSKQKKKLLADMAKIEQTEKTLACLPKMPLAEGESLKWMEGHRPMMEGGSCIDGFALVARSVGSKELKETSMHKRL